MKTSLLRGIILTCGLAFTAVTFADTTAAATSTNTGPTTDTQKGSYSLGYTIGSDFKTHSIVLDTDQFAAGMNAAMNGTTPAMSQADMKQSIQMLQTQMMMQMKAQQEKAASSNLAASNAFLAKIAKEPGVMKITDGLYYKVLTKGTGPIPGANDTVEVNYEGTLINGTVFDSSYQRGKPVSFGVSQVIPGWTKALQQMPQGSTWMLYISPDLAYGKFAPPQIGPNQALVFKVNLIQVTPASANNTANNNTQTGS